MRFAQQRNPNTLSIDNHAGTPPGDMSSVFPRETGPIHTRSVPRFAQPIHSNHVGSMALGSLSNNQRARLIGASILFVVIAAVAACGGTGNTATTVTAQPTTTEPTLGNGPHASSEQSPYWAWKLAKQDPDLKQFADYSAKEWCEPSAAVRYMKVSTQTLPIEYGFYRNKIGKPTGTPAWADDVETKSLIATYIESTYCPPDR